MIGRDGAVTWVALVLVLGACGGERVERPHTTSFVPAPVVVAEPVEREAPDALVVAPIVEAAVVAEPAFAAAPSELTPVTLIEAPATRVERFFEREDAPIREALLGGEIAEVERGRGGRSLGFKITLEDGTAGYFKPDQTFNGMSWYAEIAAYHLDRELGLGRTAPSVGRRFAWEDLRRAAGSDYRVDEILVDEDGTVEGAFIYWVPERLVTLELPEGWERWLRVEGEPDAITPFQRPNEYRAERAAGAQPREIVTPEPDVADRPAELSDLIVFDYLTNNVDRWSENRTNVRTIGEGGPIMFLDNAAGFTLRGARVPMSDLRLRHVQRFRRSTIDAVRALDVERFAERLANDPLSPELSDRELRHLETRREFLIAHVDALIAEHGEDAVYAW